MMASFQVATTYEIIDCFKCGALFGVPSDVNREMLRSGRTFFCPNGHSQHYTESTEKKLQSERDRNARLTARIDQVKADRDAVELSRRATRGQLTRVKNRVAKGVCPCCNRSFADLAAHMQTKHPDYAGAIESKT